MTRGPSGLGRLLTPASIALVGASDRSAAATAIVAALESYQYGGELFLVNTRGTSVAGRPVHRRIGDIGAPVDLAMILVPAAAVPGVVAECAASDVAAAIVFSSGFAEEGPAGARRQQELAEAAGRSGMRLLGPNTEGYLNLVRGIPASFSSNISYPQVARHFRPGRDEPGLAIAWLARGPVAVVAHSGGLGFALFNRGLGRGMRFSYVISTGNEADIEVQDVLEFLVEDADTRVIMIYLEGLKAPERFPAIAARARALGKVLVVGKGGRSAAGARASLSHTGHLAGDDAAYQAVFDKYGVISVRDPEDMLDAALALSLSPPAAGNRAAVVSLSGGSAVWMADACGDAGIELPELAAGTQARVAAVLPSFAATANPVDVSGTPGVPPAEVLSVVAEDPAVDALILVTTLARAERLAPDLPVLTALKGGPKPVLLHSYTEPAPETLSMIAAAGLPLYLSPRGCAGALAALVRTGAAEPDGPPPRIGPAGRLRLIAKDLIAEDRAGASGRTIPEYRVKELLAAAGIPVTRESLATTADAAVAAARAIGYPVALKVQSPDIPHKAAAGAVALNLRDDSAVRAAMAALLDRSVRQAPAADLHGVLVQEMAPSGVELIVGVQNTTGFGPLVLIGLGGPMVELAGRGVLYPAPFGEQTALRLLRRLRLHRLVPPAQRPGGDQDGGMARRPGDGEDGGLAPLARLVARLSVLADLVRDEVAELDINPVVWDPASGQVIAVDALAVGTDTFPKRGSREDTVMPIIEEVGG